MQYTTTFLSGGKTISAEITRPDGTARGTVIIAYGSDRMVNTSHGPWATTIRGYAADLAADGFASIIPDYFRTTDTRAGDIDFLKDGVPQIWRYRDAWQSAIEDTVGYSVTLPGADPSRIGLLGFSLGGHLCLRVRAKAKVVISFFAPILDGLGAAAPRPYAQIHHGTSDVLVRFEENARKIEQYLRATGASTELFAYEGATHGFAGSDAADSSARVFSRSRTREFFKANL